MTRHKDKTWGLKEPASYDDARLAVLMDIRDELKAINGTLRCHKFQRLPDTLERIDRRLAKHAPLKKPRA